MPLKRIDRMFVNRAEQFAAPLLAAALLELFALAGDVGDHQPAAVQHADELSAALRP